MLISTRESFVQCSFLDVVIFYAQSVNSGQAKRLCTSALENGKEKALIFIGVSVLCAFWVSVTLMKNNIHFLIKTFKSKIGGLCLRKSWFHLHPSYCPAWGTHSQPKKNGLYVECLSWSGVLISSHSKAVLLGKTTYGYNEVKQRKWWFIGKSSLLMAGPHLWEAWLHQLRSVATCLKREKQDLFIKAFSRRNVNLCQRARI